MKVRGARMGFLLSIACVTVAIYGLGIKISGFESVTYSFNIIMRTISESKTSNNIVKLYLVLMYIDRESE